MYTGVHVKCPLFLSHYNKNRIFSIELKYPQISDFWRKKIRPVEAMLFHADRHTPTDGQTDRETWWS